MLNMQDFAAYKFVRVFDEFFLTAKETTMSEQSKTSSHATDAARAVDMKNAQVIHMTGPTLKPVVVKFNPNTAKLGDVLVQVVMQED